MVDGVIPQRGGDVSERGYRDGGCSLYPSCLDCPLTVCRFDLAVNVASMVFRAAVVYYYTIRGWGADDIATEAGLSKRTVHRLRGLMRHPARSPLRLLHQTPEALDHAVTAALAHAGKRPHPETRLLFGVNEPIRLPVFPSPAVARPLPAFPAKGWRV